MSYEEEIQVIRNKIIDKTIFITVFFTLFPLSASLLRAVETGWNTVLNMHIALSASNIIIFFIKKHLSLSIKAHSVFILFFLVSILGVLNYRTINAGFFFITVISLATMLFGIKQGIIYSVLYLGLYFALGLMHINEAITNTIDYNKYVNARTTWLSFFAGYIYVSVVVIYSFSLFYNYFINSIKTAHENGNKLKDTLSKLQQSEKKFRSVIESGNDGYIFIDENFLTTYVNKSYCELSGYNKEELIGKDYKLLIEENNTSRDDFFLSLASKYDQKKNAVELPLLHKSGIQIPTDVNVYKMNLANSVYMWMVIKDLREKKNLERCIYNSMVQAEEKERGRYAKELHDGLGPLLSTAMIYIDTIKEESDICLVNNYAHKCQKIIAEANKTIKEISNNLSPLVLKEYGIAQAVRSFIEKIQQAANINFIITENIPIRLAEITEFTLYRILTELINNSIKYAEANSVKITFDKKNNTYTIHYSDDGKGFDRNKQEVTKKGFGLLNLDNRIKKIGGKYQYQTSPGKGVQVTIQLKHVTYD